MSRLPLALALLVASLGACTTPKPRLSADKSPGGYSYAVNLRHLEQGRLRVNVVVPPSAAQQAVFVFPKLVPGIYGNLSFGQYVADFTAYDRQNRPLAVVRQDTNRWVIADAGRLHHLTYLVAPTWREFVVTDAKSAPFYRSAGSSYHPDSAFVLNYSTFVGYFEDQRPRPYEVRFTKPAGFYGASHLTPAPVNDSVEVVRAPSYAELVDAPLLYARPDTAWLQVGATRVLVALYDATSKQPYAPVLARALKTMLEAQRAYLGGTLPVANYSFLVYHTTGPKGLRIGDGLEHSHSTLVLQESPDLQDLSKVLPPIAAHEFFHIVTPLNIHAEQIEQYDFLQPTFSEHLWLYEGLTEYATIHFPIRGGLETLPEFLATLERKAKAMSKYDNTLSLTQLSRNVAARQDQIYNFYLKGALFNLCLDIRLRELSGGKMGTQQLTQQLLRRYGPHTPFADDQLFDVLTQLTYPEMRPFFRDYLEDGKPLPLAETLAKVGLLYDPTTYNIRVAAQPTPAQLALRQSWIGQ
ncbi:peptidase M61 [uncultured Hymenobacter sp.]|uniref:M61 family metallopeptidase n=1 Tax=uncultured Hymenobacter sp. TaxID=170016 RepID=UPI0035CA418C